MTKLTVVPDEDIPVEELSAAEEAALVPDSDEDPAIPAEDPGPLDPTIPYQLPVASTFRTILNGITADLVGDTNNRTDKQQYRLKALDVAWVLTRAEFGRIGVNL